MATSASRKTHDPEGQINARCNLCGTVKDLKRCARCTQVFYCSKEHQTEDWKQHKKVCKKFTAMQRGTAKSQPVQSYDVIGSLPSHGKQNVKQVSVGETDSSTVPSPTQHSGGTDNKSVTPRSVISQDMAQSTDLKSKLFNPGSKLSGACYKPRQFPKPDSYDASSIALHVYKHLMKDGFCVIDNLQDVERARSLASEVKLLYQTGKFVDGQLGGGKTSGEDSQKLVEKRIRGDKIIMLEGNEPIVPNICQLNLFLTSVIKVLNYYLQGQYTISGRTKLPIRSAKTHIAIPVPYTVAFKAKYMIKAEVEVMVACYPGNGTGYACHVDNPNKDGRCITCLYYLNEGWDVKKQGGLLRLYPEGSTDYVDIEPILNRVLFFWSDRRSPHEVQPAYDTRYAVTIWYLDKNERHKAKETQTKLEMDKAKVELAMMNIHMKEEEKRELEAKQARVTKSAVDNLTPEELESISQMIKGSSDPKECLTSLGIAESIQSELIQRLKQRDNLG